MKWLKVKEWLGRIKVPWKEVFLITVGFGFTTLAGNTITAKYQERLWKEQSNEKKLSDELEVARETFESVSENIDKRIYRMTKLNLWLRENRDEDMIDKQMEEYRSILYDWNDSFNKDKAKLNLYFGKDIAEKFDYIHGFFKKIGESLGEEYYVANFERNQERLLENDGRIGDLSNMALEINEMMIRKLQNQKVGIFQ